MTASETTTRTVPAQPTTHCQRYVPNFPALSFAEIVFDHLTTQFPRPLLLICDSDEYCDCREKATVHLIETEEDLCLRHFEKRLKENL